MTHSVTPIALGGESLVHSVYAGDIDMTPPNAEDIYIQCGFKPAHMWFMFTNESTPANNIRIEWTAGMPEGNYILIYPGGNFGIEAGGPIYDSSREFVQPAVLLPAAFMSIVGTDPQGIEMATMDHSVFRLFR